MKILIADDDEVVRFALEDILKEAGHEIDFAQDGVETLNQTKKNLYDLVLLDIEMPKISGYEVLKEIRANFPEMPVIFVSGKGVAKKVSRSIVQDKLTAFIEKPFVSKQVLEIINKTIQLSSKKLM